MKATRVLYNLGQSFWLDNITRDLLTSGTLKKYIESLSVTGLTSNPTIFDHAISRSNAYDAEIRRLVGRGLSGETLFFELAIQDLTQAADLFAPIHERTNGVDGWVSLEVSPLLAYDLQKSSDEAKALHAKANRRNLFIKIPGTREGLPAIEETIASGVPVNVTLLFSREQYEAAAEAYLRGLERRFSAGLSLDVHSVASLFVSRWDKATMDKVPGNLRDKLGIAISQQAYKSYRDLLETDRWQRLAAHGARPQRLLFASTGTKDPQASDVLYIGALSRSQHRQHHARRNASRLRRTRQSWGRIALLWWGLWSTSSRTLPRLDQDRRACRSVAVGGSQGFRRFLAGSVERNRVQNEALK